MAYGLIFSLLGGVLGWLAVQGGGWNWVLLWPAVSFLVVGLAYCVKSPAVFGKRSDGTMAGWAVFLLLPYLTMTWGLWHVVRWGIKARKSEPCASEVVRGVWLSRRVLAGEVPVGVVCVVDMTCEFFAASGVRGAVDTYVCLPTLDYGVPAVEAAVGLVKRLSRMEGGVLVHCAQGHGRSAMMVAALLIARGVTPDAGAALMAVRAARPKIQLSGEQRRLLEEMAVRLRGERIIRRGYESRKAE